MDSKMKRITTILLLVLIVALVNGAAQRPDQGEVLLKAAIQKETVDGDLKAAIEQYRNIISSGNSSRAVVARAMLQLGGCYEKQGNADARKIFEQLVKDYTDQPEILAQARLRLSASSSIATGLAIRKLSFNRTMYFDGSPSPDERYLAYGDDLVDLAVYDFTAGSSRKLTEKERDSRLAVDGIRWSSDSRHIAFIWGASVRDVSAKWDLCLIDPDGTNRRVIYSDDTNSLALYGWLPDGKSLLISTKKGDQPQQLFRISVDNGSMQLIRSLPETQILAYRSSLSSDGRYLAYTTDPYSKRDLFVLPVSGGAPVKINDQAGDITIIGWTPDSRSFLFTSDMGVSTSLWRIDLSQGKPLDHPVLVQENIGRVSPLGITANGSIFYYSEKTYIDVYTVGIDLTSGKIIGAVEQVNTTHLGMSRTPAWSHDGESLAYMAASSADEPANTTLCVWSAKDRKHTEFRLRMPITIGASGHLSWSPNGRYIFGATFNRATRAYELARIDSQTGEVSIVAALQNATIIGWARDGAFTLAIRRDNGAPLIVKRDSLSGDEKECFRKPVGNYTWRGDILSPDGNWMLVGHGEPRSNVRQLLLVPTGAGEPRELASANAGLRFGFWSPDSHSLFCFQSAGQGIYDLWKASLDGGMPAKVSQISIPGMNTFSISLHPDGKRIAFESSTHKTEYWVMENLPLSGDQKREEH